MKEETSEKIEGVKIRDRIGKNLLNVGVFAMEVLVLVLLGPWAFKFFLPMLTGWLIARLQIHWSVFWKNICILSEATVLLALLQE